VYPDYILDSEVCFIHAWTPFPNGGCGGVSGGLEGNFTPTTVTKGWGGGGFRGSAPKVKF
jgi:hypothetical protein